MFNVPWEINHSTCADITTAPSSSTTSTGIEANIRVLVARSLVN